MRKLIKKLNKNRNKEIALSVELDIVSNGVFWNSSQVTKEQREFEMLGIKTKQQANLSKRFNLLESLEIEVTKAKQDTSTRQREVNLSKEG